MRCIVAITLVLGLALLVGSCAEDEEEDKVDPQASADKENLAVFSAFDTYQNAEDPSDFTGMDFTQSYNLFEEAVGLDPNNSGARVGAAVTNLLKMPNDPMIQSLMEELGGGFFLSPPWSPGVFETKRSPGWGVSRLILEGMSGKGPVQQDLQLLLQHLVTVLDHSIAYFNLVEADEDFEWLIEFPVAEGIVETLEVDVTDVYFIESPLHWLKAFLLGMMAYDMELASLDDEGLAAAMSQGSDFMTLTNPTALSQSGDALETGAEEISNGAESLRGEEADQRHDLIYEGEGFGKDAAGWFPLTSDQVDTLLMMPTILEGLMTIPMEIVDDWDDDLVTEDDTLWVNLGRLFDSPVQDWKAIVPDYEIVPCFDEFDTTMTIIWDAGTIDEWMWHPDSLHGLIQLPGGAEMDSEDMREIFGLDSLYLDAGCK